MTVAQLRALLCRLPPEAEVVIDEDEPLDGLLLVSSGQVWVSTATDPMFVHAIVPPEAA